MSQAPIALSGRCTRCLTYVETSGVCLRCWPRAMSEAAESVLSLDESFAPNLITAHVEDVPVFRPLLRAAGFRPTSV